jgi:hypothetical protein
MTVPLGIPCQRRKIGGFMLKARVHPWIDPLIQPCVIIFIVDCNIDSRSKEIIREWRKIWVKNSFTTEITEFTEKIRRRFSVFSVGSVVKPLADSRN